MVRKPDRRGVGAGGPSGALLRNLIMGVGEYPTVVGEEDVPIRGGSRTSPDVDLRSRPWAHAGVAEAR